MTTRRACPGRGLITLAALAALAGGCGGGDERLGRRGDAFPALTESGAWCWFADPRAVHQDKTRRRTYVGWVTGGGAVQVGYYDHADGATAAATVREGLQRDDHANPALLALPNGRLMVFYSAHGGRRMFYRVSREPEDISAWWSERRLHTNTAGRHGYTYPNPLLLRGEGDRIYLFWRGGDFKPAYASTVDGLAWTRARTLIRGKGDRPYVKYVSDGDVSIHFAFTDGHPRREPTNSIYYAYYRSGSLNRADGLVIRSMNRLPLRPAEAERVYDGRRSTGRAWVWDIALDMAGRPVIVYAVAPTVSDHRYRYARWTGTGWTDHEITAAGGWFPQTPEGGREPEPHYSGGAALDHADPSVVYVSRKTGGTFEIEEWTTPDDGESWSSRRVTSGSHGLNVRPVLARTGLKDESLLLWMNGKYEHYTKYETAIRMAVVRRRPG